jgi:hypothetical protein
MIQRTILASMLTVYSLLGCTDNRSTSTSTTESSEAPERSLPAELQYVNSISAKLEIELTEPPQQIGNLANMTASPTARIKSLRLLARVEDAQGNQYRSLSFEELSRIAFPKPEIRLRGNSGDPVLHKAPNGRHFTVQELLLAIEETERRTRGESNWFGGIDVHHIYFEGIRPIANDVWSISWGS